MRSTRARRQARGAPSPKASRQGAAPRANGAGGKRAAMQSAEGLSEKEAKALL